MSCRVVDVCCKCGVVSCGVVSCGIIHASPHITPTPPTTQTTAVRFFQSDRHRKIAQYVSITGDVTDTVGHGTHTAGSIAGKPTTGSPAGTNVYQGMAPDAKLAVFDLGGAKPESVSIPYSLDRTFFPFAYQVVRGGWGSVGGGFCVGVIGFLGEGGGCG